MAHYASAINVGIRFSSSNSVGIEAQNRNVEAMVAVAVMEAETIGFLATKSEEISFIETEKLTTCQLLLKKPQV